FTPFITVVGFAVVGTVVADFSGPCVDDAVATNCGGAVIITAGAHADVVAILAFFYDAVSADSGRGPIAKLAALVGLAVATAIITDFAFVEDAVSAILGDERV